MKHIVIVGGGAAGLMSAIYAKTPTNQVTILERNPVCGKKILATGNGKCNYWNIDQSLTHYNSSNKELLEKIITEENKQEVLSFFNSLGIIPKIKNGYYYPFSNQATTIRDALLREVLNKGIIIRNDFLVEKIDATNQKFLLTSSTDTITADKVIIATGSCASPKTGSDGIGYRLLKQLNHQYIEPYPALVQLKTTGSYLKQWAGIRTDVIISLYEDNKFLKQELGEIQLTDYGISGICVFNLSRHVAIGLSQHKKEEVFINFLPFLKETNETLEDILLKTNLSLKDQLSNILNNKLVEVILSETKLNSRKSYKDLSTEEKRKLEDYLTNFKVTITATNSFEQAQVCSGGLPLTSINLSTMESKQLKNLYIVGELLDVDGECGGYNLSFAWITGLLAGKGSASND